MASMIRSLHPQARIQLNLSTHRSSSSTNINHTAKTHHVDIAIVGGGGIGSALACALAQSPSLSNHIIALIDSSPIYASPPPSPYHVSNRVVSLTPKSVQFLKDIHAWSNIPFNRIHAYEHMEVWDAVGNGKVSFTASEVNEQAIGYIAELPVVHRAIVQALPSSVQVFQSANIRPPIVLDPSETTDRYPVVELGTGDRISARLVVGADGLNSVVRRELVTDSDPYGHDYKARGLVATLTIEPTLTSNTTAWQRFLPSGPIAMLPVSDGVSSLVWSMDQSSSLLEHAAVTEKALARLINAAFFYPSDELHQLMFKLKFESEKALLEHLAWRDSVHEQAISSDLVNIPPYVLSVENGDAFPLRVQHVLRYTGHRAVLVGDACHVTHPLAGQGMNLGIADAACLTRVLSDAARDGADIGHARVLEAYPRERYVSNAMMLSACDALNSVFGNERLARVRSYGMNVFNRWDWVKQRVMRFAMGI